jgi:light-regulated signal transduction histidine kinase (bacteriophytochrome)
VVITPLRDEKGELHGFSKITRDITGRKAAETLLAGKIKELNRSNEELAQFASIAAHDLQEPLRMVCEYLALLSRRYKASWMPVPMSSLHSHSMAAAGCSG